MLDEAAEIRDEQGSDGPKMGWLWPAANREAWLENETAADAVCSKSNTRCGENGESPFKTGA